MPRAQWQRLVDVNLTGVFTCCQAKGAAMLGHGAGSIVNIGSISASIANRGLSQVRYDAAKAAVVHLTTSLALEWAGRGVRVNAVSPGYRDADGEAPRRVAARAGVHEGHPARADCRDRGARPAGGVPAHRGVLYCTGANLLVDVGAVAC